MKIYDIKNEHDCNRSEDTYGLVYCRKFVLDFKSTIIINMFAQTSLENIKYPISSLKIFSRRYFPL